MTNGTATTRHHGENSGAEPVGTAGQTRPPAIDVEGLAVRYADGTTAVEDLSITVPNGEFFGLLGPNGAGKTTTIKALVSLLPPTDGAVRIHGYDLASAERAVRSTIGYMAQETSVDGELTGRENLQFACEAYGVPSAERPERIETLLDLVDLADVADEAADTFSGGMQKRLDAATALVHDPELVFLDEPTTGLDPQARNRLWDYFGRINDAGTTFVLTTQYLEEADTLCDRLAVIRDGTIVERGSPEELKRRVGESVLEIEIDGGEAVLARAVETIRNAEAFGDRSSLTTVDGTLRIATPSPIDHGLDLLVAIRDAGVPVTGFSTEGASLDDVFLALAEEGRGSTDRTTSTGGTSR